MEVKILNKERFVDMRTEISYRIVYSKTERFTEHAHDYYEIFVMLSGRTKHTVAGKTVQIGEGALAALESKISYLATIDHDSTDDLKTALRIMLMELMTSNFYNYATQADKMPLWLERLLITMRKFRNDE